MNEYIKLKKRDTLKIGIKDENDVPKLDENGHEVFIEFDLEDITIADRYDTCFRLIKKATNNLQSRLVIINKKQDVPGKGYMSRNEKEKMDAVETYFKETEEAMDLFLGKGGTTKIFGEVRYLEMFDDLNEYLKPVAPLLKLNMESIEKRIKSKYSTTDNSTLKENE